MGPSHPGPQPRLRRAGRRQIDLSLKCRYIVISETDARVESMHVQG